MNNFKQNTTDAEFLKLSICIATYNRARFIGETLDSILHQMVPGVELVVVNGASPDNTHELMGHYIKKYPAIRYYRESVNSGIDADFDKAVGYARGEYCWLMTDDDLLHPGAIVKVMSYLNRGDQLVVVNSEVRNTDLSEVFEERRLLFNEDRTYQAEDSEAFFKDLAGYLSFIGCVVIKREVWLSRNRSAYYGTVFIHVGVIFQSPAIESITAIAEPLIIIRYGNAMWTPRGFEIWMFKWPKLIWSFPKFSDKVKRIVCRKEPYKSVKALFHNRAFGAYTKAEFKRFIPADLGKMDRLIAYFLSVFPASLANLIMVMYFAKKNKPEKIALHDLLYSRNAGFLSRQFARFFINES